MNATAGGDRRPIALAGFMGVGKTTIGRLLAERLERPFHDTDACVEAAAGRSVEDFFRNHEEGEFRRLEAAAVADLVVKGPVVIALGGGALMDDTSRRTLTERSVLVHLHVPWTQLRERVPALIATRPLLRDRTPADIRRLYLLRLATYASAAIRITIRRGTPAQAAEQVLAALRRQDSTPASG